MARQYDLLIFDWDGTLMDSVDKIVVCFQKAARDCSIGDLKDDAIRLTVGLGVTDALMRLLPTADTHTRAAVAERYREHFLFLDKSPMPLFPEVWSGLHDLRARGYRLAVATGKSRQGLDHALIESGTASLFQLTRCANETRSKPDPLMLTEILQETGIVVSRALMIGDTSYDMEMAQRIEMAGVAVTYGVHSRETLLAHNPRACFDSFSGLCQWLA